MNDESPPKINPEEYLGREVDRIDLSKSVPYNDPSCPHTNMEPEPEEDIPGTVTLKCTDCPYGIIVRKA